MLRQSTVRNSLPQEQTELDSRVYDPDDVAMAETGVTLPRLLEYLASATYSKLWDLRDAVAGESDFGSMLDITEASTLLFSRTLMRGFTLCRKLVTPPLLSDLIALTSDTGLVNTMVFGVHTSLETLSVMERVAGDVTKVCNTIVPGSIENIKNAADKSEKRRLRRALCSRIDKLLKECEIFWEGYGIKVARVKKETSMKKQNWFIRTITWPYRALVSVVKMGFRGMLRLFGVKVEASKAPSVEELPPIGDIRDPFGIIASLQAEGKIDTWEELDAETEGGRIEMVRKRFGKVGVEEYKRVLDANQTRINRWKKAYRAMSNFEEGAAATGYDSDMITPEDIFFRTGKFTKEKRDNMREASRLQWENIQNPPPIDEETARLTLCRLHDFHDRLKQHRWDFDPNRPMSLRYSFLLDLIKWESKINTEERRLRDSVENFGKEYWETVTPESIAASKAKIAEMKEYFNTELLGVAIKFGFLQEDGSFPDPNSQYVNADDHDPEKWGDAECDLGLQAYPEFYDDDGSLMFDF